MTLPSDDDEAAFSFPLGSRMHSDIGCIIFWLSRTNAD